MKQFLILLISITTLTISINTFSNFNQNTNFSNNLQTNNNNDIQTLIFNNQYGYLNTSDWITNQSTADHKFYSYDTSALKNYTFANARNTFLVDTTGNLVYNPGVTIPNKEKINIANTKQEIINHHQINAIKYTYNPYSNSIYDNNYFTSRNEKWQFLQMGGIENHIDISKQSGADKVENFNNLSETLGLYYIAKAVRQNKISQTIANNLGKCFINQSSLKDKLSENLTNKIINLIITNKKIFNFIYYMPFYNNSEKYSLNFVFDDNNNLITLYYNKWNSNYLKPIITNNKLDAKSDISGAGIVKTNSVSSNEFFLSWKKLKVNSLNQFISAFNKVYINFDKLDISYISLEGDSTYSVPGFNSNISLNTLFTNNWYKTTLATYWTHNYFGHCEGELYLYTKCIDKGIIFQSTASVTGGGSTYGDHIYGNISVNNIIFN